MYKRLKTLAAQLGSMNLRKEALEVEDLSGSFGLKKEALWWKIVGYGAGAATAAWGSYQAWAEAERANMSNHLDRYDPQRQAENAQQTFEKFLEYSMKQDINNNPFSDQPGDGTNITSPQHQIDHLKAWWRRRWVEERPVTEAEVEEGYQKILGSITFMDDEDWYAYAFNAILNYKLEEPKERRRVAEEALQNTLREIEQDPTMRIVLSSKKTSLKRKIGQIKSQKDLTDFLDEIAHLGQKKPTSSQPEPESPKPEARPSRPSSGSSGLSPNIFD